MLDGQIALLQQTIAEARKTLLDANLPAATAATYQDLAAKAERGLAEFVAKKATVDSTLATVQQIIAAGPTENAQVSDELRLLGQVITAGGSSVSGEIGLWLKIAGGLVTALSLALAGWQTQRASRTKTDLVNVVASVDSVFDAKLIPDPKAAKELLAKRQGMATAAAVNGIKNA